jgi:hypothetical protein
MEQSVSPSIMYVNLVGHRSMVLTQKQLKCAGESGAARIPALACGLFLNLLGALSLCANGTQPLVAVHDSEYTRALENINAFGATPARPGSSGGSRTFVTSSCPRP